MKPSRGPVAGESRTCPHCKATILKSAVSCPLCQHVLRFGSAGADPGSSPTTCPLAVQATVQHAGTGDALEYSVLMEVHDETGKLISRHAVGVGAINRTEKRTFSVRVELSSPVGPL